MRPRTARRPAVVGLITFACILGGCGGAALNGIGGRLAAVSLDGSPVELPIVAKTAVYDNDEDGESLFYLTDMRERDLLEGEVDHGQFLAIRLLWNPKPGATPMDASATNASVLLVIKAGDDLGVYGGAGYALPHGSPGASRLRVTLRESTLTLLDATPGFNDLLSPSLVTGSFVVERRPDSARRHYVAASQLVTNALGSSTVLGVESWR